MPGISQQAAILYAVVTDFGDRITVIVAEKSL